MIPASNLLKADGTELLEPAAPPAMTDSVSSGGHRINLVFVRHPRARRYILRLRPDGAAQVTVPRAGTVREAREFVGRHLDWLLRQVERQHRLPRRGSHAWRIGDTVWFRGQPEVLSLASPTAEGALALRLGGERIPVEAATDDVRPAVQAHLWRMAWRELPPLTLDFAGAHGLQVTRVTIRNQRSRWGSCSPRGAISLNWRLVQMPEASRDYIILHELMHLRQPNHSPRFWEEVARVCPGYREAAAWIRRHQAQLR